MIAPTKRRWIPHGLLPPGAVYKRDFWADENTKYTRPHHRMLKVARLVNRLAAGKRLPAARRRVVVPRLSDSSSIRTCSTTG